MSNSTTLKTKGGYYVWLVSGSALRQKFSPHPHTHCRQTCQFFFVLDVWHDDTRRKHLKSDHMNKMIFQTHNVLAARYEFKKRADSVLKPFFAGVWGFSHLVCSLNLLALTAEIHVTNMRMTPLIKTMQDDYSYLCISIMSSLQVHLCMRARTLPDTHTHTHHTWGTCK